MILYRFRDCGGGGGGDQGTQTRRGKGGKKKVSVRCPNDKNDAGDKVPATKSQALTSKQPEGLANIVRLQCNNPAPIEVR